MTAQFDAIAQPRHLPCGRGAGMVCVSQTFGKGARHARLEDYRRGVGGAGFGRGGARRGIRRGGLEPLRYNHPGLVVDLGVGLWAQPLPMDFDATAISTWRVVRRRASNGTYFFENPGATRCRSSSGCADRPRMGNVQVSHVGGQIRVLTRASSTRISRSGASPFATSCPWGRHPCKQGAREPLAHCRYDGDGRLDLIVGVEDWTEYGWDNAFDAEGDGRAGRCTA